MIQLRLLPLGKKNQAVTTVKANPKTLVAKGNRVQIALVNRNEKCNVCQNFLRQ
jgi:hypothetical protein